VKTSTLAVAGLLAVLLIGIVWFIGAQAPAAPSADLATRHAKGSPAAPVVVEEWGDFQ
jgi:hypothetical protein